MHRVMPNTHHGRLLTLNRIPVVNGFVTFTADENTSGPLRPQCALDMSIPLEEPLILEESEIDRLIVMRHKQGQPPAAFFYHH